MSLAFREEKSAGRAQSLLWSASSSGQAGLHWCLADGNHKYSWHREPQRLGAVRFPQPRDKNAPPPPSRVGYSFCSRGQWACMPVLSQLCFPPPCPLCEAQTSRGDTLLCIYRGKRRPDFISHLSLPLVLIYSFFSPLLLPQPWAWRWSQLTWEAAEWCGKIKPEGLGSYYLGDV